MAALAALPLGGCGVDGPPAPQLSLPAVDLHTDAGKIDGSTALAAPTGWKPSPTEVTPTFSVPAPQLFTAMQEILQAEPRTWRGETHPDQYQASFIVRSVMLNLPDVVVVQAVPVGPAASNAVILSRSRYDVLPYLSENKARVRHLVQILTSRFGTVTAPGPIPGGKS